MYKEQDRHNTCPLYCLWKRKLFGKIENKDISQLGKNGSLHLIRFQATLRTGLTIRIPAKAPWVPRKTEVWSQGCRYLCTTETQIIFPSVKGRDLIRLNRVLWRSVSSLKGGHPTLPVSFSSAQLSQVRKGQWGKALQFSYNCPVKCEGP